MPRPAPCPPPAAVEDDRNKAQTSPLDAWGYRLLARASLGLSPISLSLAYADWALHMAVSPGRQHELGVLAVQQAQRWWQQQFAHLQAPAPEPAPALPGDERFADPAWSHWPHSLWRDAFLHSAAWWDQASRVDGISRHHQHLATFYARQWLDALSPSNVPWLNPQVQQQAWQTRGGSLATGLYKLAIDALTQHGAGLHASPQALPFAVGKEVAVTPGAVVYRHHLFELIQYQPSTARVRAEPLLIVPSTIMKYYILDLSPHNSMVRYLVAQGFTVFMVSWRNPQAADRALGLDDYVIDGVMRALQMTRRIAGAEQVHAMGYCLGGTYLAIVAALLGALSPTARRPMAEPRAPARLWPKPLPQLASVTLLAAETDFSEPGELGLFIDEDQLRTVRAEMARTGYLSGRQMAATFQFLNSRDLVWSRHVRRYLLGQDEVDSDMMSWNADTTRLPERMHNEYLQQFFLDNALHNGHYKVAGRAVALENIAAPLMVVGTEWDHVSPWRSVFKILRDIEVEAHFILAARGHNAGIVSAPGQAQRHHRIGVQAAGQPWVEPDAWVARTACTEGSWWPAWARWLHRHSAPQERPARPVPTARALAAAPGPYVRVRYND